MPRIQKEGVGGALLMTDWQTEVGRTGWAIHMLVCEVPMVREDRDGQKREAVRGKLAARASSPLFHVLAQNPRTSRILNSHLVCQPNYKVNVSSILIILLFVCF